MTSPGRVVTPCMAVDWAMPKDLGSTEDPGECVAHRCGNIVTLV